MKITNKQILYYRKPSLVEERNNLKLLLWGDLGEWIVVDNETIDFVEIFNGTLSFKEVLKKYCIKQNTNDKEAIKNATNIAQELYNKKIIFDKKEIIKKEDEEVDIVNITFNITNRCNLDCIWCYNKKRNNNEIPIEKMIKKIDLKSKLFSKKISFFVLGGEPFVDFKRLKKLIDYICFAYSITPLISTNGTLLTNESIEYLKTKKIEIQVSLDSYSENKNDEIRGGGMYKKTISGINNLVKNNIYTILSMTYSKDSIKDFEKYFELAKKLNVNEVRFIPLRIIGKAENYQELIPNQLEALNNLIDILKRKPEYKKLLGRDFFSIALSVCQYSSQRDNCGIGRRVIFVDADGSVYPCPNYINSEYLCGNLNIDNLSDIIKSSPVLKDVRDKYKVSKYRKCSECNVRFWCAGDCRAETLAITKSHHESSPHCEQLYDLYKEMFWLIANNYSFSNKPKVREGYFK